MNRQALDALLAGAISCIGTGAFATQSDIAFDAFKMCFILTVIVPPAIMLVGWLTKSEG